MHDPMSASDPDGTHTEVELVHIQDPSDLLTAIPFVLGFEPHCCLVVVALDDDHRLVATISADFPSIRDAPIAADGISHYLAAAGTTSVLMVGYCPRQEAHIVTLVATLLPWPVHEVLLVADQHWWSLTHPNEHAEGQPVVTQDRVQAPLLVASGAPADSRAVLAASLDPGCQQTLEQVRTHLTDVLASDGWSDAQALYAQVTQARAARAAAGSPDVSPEQAAVLLVALRHKTVRDACTLWIDDHTVTLWKGLVPLAPPGWVAPVATVLALAAYQRGDGVMARLAADRALDDDPGYALAHLIAQAIRHGIPPHRLQARLTAALATNPLAAAQPPETP